MFLNIRLLIVALFASIVALSCELGVFAAFGVSLRPLTHMPTDTGSLQLVSEDRASASTRTWGARIGTGAPSSNIKTEGTASDAPRLTAFPDGAIGAAGPVSPGTTFVPASPEPIEHAAPALDEQGSPRPQQAAGPKTAAASTVKAPAAGLPAPPEPKPSPGTAPIVPLTPASAKSVSVAPITDTAVALIASAPAAQNPPPMAPVPAAEPKPSPNTKKAAAPLQAASQQAAPDGAQPRTVRKSDRKARQRVAAAKRLIRKKPAPTAGLFVRSVRGAGNGRP